MLLNSTLVSADGHQLGAHLAQPAAQPRGGLVVLQEIFGVNHHIRSVCDRFAEAGFAAIAPALFDRQERQFESGYTPDDVTRALGFVQTIDLDLLLADTKAAIDEVARFGPVGVVGFCLGGSLAYLSAARLDGVSAAVGYYGGLIAQHADETPRVPTMLHFGELDKSVPPSHEATVRQKQPQVETHLYAGAAHGFNCDERAAYHPEAARLAWERTLGFLNKHLTGK